MKLIVAGSGTGCAVGVAISNSVPVESVPTIWPKLLMAFMLANGSLEIRLLKLVN
jgi:hypothetical protein